MGLIIPAGHRYIYRVADNSSPSAQPRQTLIGARQVGKTTLARAVAASQTMHSALEHLHLDGLYAVHAGRDRFMLDRRIVALPLADVGNVVGAAEVIAAT